jgi:hypothetical protein
MIQSTKLQILMRSLTAALGVMMMLVACSSDSDDSGSAGGRRPSAYIQFDAMQIAYLGSGMHGSGVMTFNGRQYAVDVTALGVGGLGISYINAQGDVYDLYNIQDFAGLYGQARMGWAVASAGGGKMWLQNDNGVVIHLKTERQGITLAGGLDAINVSFAR